MTLSPVYRDSDGEHVGWLRPEGTGAAALTRLGHVLGADLSEDSARELLEHAGLAAIAEPWWALAPTPLVADTDLRSPAPGWTWRRFRVREASVDTAWLGLDWAEPGEADIVLAVPLPAADLLLKRPPQG